MRNFALLAVVIGPFAFPTGAPANGTIPIDCSQIPIRIDLPQMPHVECVSAVGNASGGRANLHRYLLTAQSEAGSTSGPGDLLIVESASVDPNQDDLGKRFIEPFYLREAVEKLPLFSDTYRWGAGTSEYGFNIYRFNRKNAGDKCITFSRFSSLGVPDRYSGYVFGVYCTIDPKNINSKGVSLSAMQGVLGKIHFQ